MSSEYDCLLKIVLIGDSNVGKTSFFRAFTQTRINDMLIATIGVDFTNKIIEVGDKLVKVLLWDTAGLERFRELTTQYYRGTSIILLFYDTTHNQSFENIKRWLSSVNGVLPREDYTLVLVGTKIDLKNSRAVFKTEAEELAKELGAKYYEISLSVPDKATFEQTNQIISNTILEHLVTHSVRKRSSVKQVIIQNESSQNEEKVGCCY